MYKFDIKTDFEKLKEIINKGGISDESYSRPYPETNEHIKEILSNFNIENKDILTVLGSGDQPFYFYNNGAKNVDVFDINKIAIYYYYLRIWLIKYFDMFYPEHFDDYKWESLKTKIIITSKEEQLAKQFWDLFFNRYMDLNVLIDSEFCSFKNSIRDLSLLKEKYEKSNINFYNIDITSKDIRLNKKYDIIYTSNISDWISYDLPDTQREKTLINYCNNLNRLLKDDGIIIRAYVFRFFENKEETEVFKKYFDRYCTNKIKIKNSYLSPGYYYVKK